MVPGRLSEAIRRLEAPVRALGPDGYAFWVDALFAFRWAKLDPRNAEPSSQPILRALVDAICAVPVPPFKTVIEPILALEETAQRAHLAVMPGFAPVAWAEALAAALRRHDCMPSFFRLGGLLAQASPRACDAYLAWLRPRVGFGSALWSAEVSDAVVTCLDHARPPWPGLQKQWDEILSVNPYSQDIDGHYVARLRVAARSDLDDALALLRTALDEVGAVSAAAGRTAVVARAARANPSAVRVVIDELVDEPDSKMLMVSDAVLTLPPATAAHWMADVVDDWVAQGEDLDLERQFGGTMGWAAALAAAEAWDETLAPKGFAVARLPPWLVLAATSVPRRCRNFGTKTWDSQRGIDLFRAATESTAPEVYTDPRVVPPWADWSADDLLALWWVTTVPMPAHGWWSPYGARLP